MPRPAREGMMGLGRRGLVASALPLVLLAGPAAQAAPGAPSAVDRLRDTRERLSSARIGLGEADRLVEQARTDLAAIDAQLDAATSVLRLLQRDLRAQERAYRQARLRTTRITARLLAVDTELGALVAQADRQQRRLDDRAAATYMHGGAARPGGMWATLLGATDLHHLSMGARVVKRVFADQRQLIDHTSQLTVATARARHAVAMLRIQRLVEERAAVRARDRLQAIAARQAALTAEVAAERARRAELLRRTQDDRAQAEALVRQLQRASAALAARLQRAISIRWQDLKIDGPMPAWAARLPAHGRRWAPAIAQAAVRLGIDPRLFAALVWAESSFHPGAVSAAGAVGLAQLMPHTARALGVDPYHPLQNLAGGARYLASQHARFGSVELALAAYNAGPAAVEAHGGIPPYAETQFYVLAVLRYYERLSAA